MTVNTPDPPVARRGGEGEEDDSGEDVRSDDEFNFMEDKQTLNGLRISSVGTGASTGSFSVRFDGCSEPASSLTSVASSVRSDDFVGKTQFQVDDFARMLSDFKGFGSSPPTPSIPEPPQIPLVVVNDPREKDDATSGEGRETGSETVSSEPIENSSTDNGEVSETGDLRVRMKSVGEYVKLNESRAAAQGLILDKNDPAVPISLAESKPDGANQLTPGDAGIPSYVEVLHDSQTSAKSPEAPKTPEPIYDSPRQDDSYSVFERSQAQASAVAGGLATPKVENLKPRLPFPVLLCERG